MDARLLAVFNRLSEDLGNLEKALATTRTMLQALSKEMRAEAMPDKVAKRNMTATRRFLANQQPRVNGTFLQRAWPRENDEEQ